MKLNLFIIIIVALPILGSIVAGFLGRKIGVRGSQFITCFSLLISSILISFAFYKIVLCGGGAINLNLGSWVDSGILTIGWEFKFDNLSISLGLAVLYCSTLIHIYSISYLESDPHIQRFFAYLSAFTGGMLVLVFGGNYFVMFVGWEAIGVFSYLLINFYFTRIQANKAAILAFTMNRTGDMVLSIGFFGLFGLFGTLNYETIFSLAPHANELAITIVSLLIIGGSLAKSAQIPLHSWLPGSMEAPTPVSALLHAAAKYIKTNIFSLGRHYLLHYIIKNHIFYFNYFFFSILSTGWAIIAARPSTLKLIDFLQHFSYFLFGREQSLQKEAVFHKGGRPGHKVGTAPLNNLSCAGVATQSKLKVLKYPWTLQTNPVSILSRSLKFKVNFFTRPRCIAAQAKVIFNYLSFIFSPFFPGIRLCAKPLCRNKVVASNSKVRGRAITALTKALPALYKRGYSPQLSRKVKILIVTRAPFALCKSGYSSQYNRGIEEFIPWKLTSSGINALTSINKFYIWIPNENPIKSFIDTHCLNLLKSEPFLGQKDTGILTSFYTVESMLSNSGLLDCKYLRSPEKAFDDISSSYIYSFINKKDHRFYIGSTINPTSRLHNYIHSWTIARQGLLQEMRTSGGGFDNYYFFCSAPGIKSTKLFKFIY